MNYTYFGNRIERSPLGNMGLQLLEAQEKLVSQEYEVENLRIKAAMYKAYFFRNSSLAEKLQKQSEENRDALIGEFDGFSYASWRANAVYRTLENMCDEGLLTEKEYRECKVRNKSFLGRIRKERMNNMNYSKLKYIRLFRDEYSEEKWKTICEVLGVTANEKLISIELGVVKVTPQIH